MAGNEKKGVTDSLHIHLLERESADSVKVAHGLVLDFDTGGNLVSLDIDQASKRIDLSGLEADGLPVGRIMVTGPRL
ncbi:Protein of unknown function [Thermanaeromonas toyohensis ToBE]|uniref:DUF2283 domain-containing protein n=2 Tax=Thermanaeromonas TaxID=202949 RepID=A0A1W1VSD4_9FIRM|nr:Protein of unknown function [Thermanaeromonas toyohensis ToBE]